jgi:hypothetical protein
VVEEVVHTLFQLIEMVNLVVQEVVVLQDLQLVVRQHNQLNQVILAHMDLETQLVNLAEVQGHLEAQVVEV